MNEKSNVKLSTKLEFINKKHKKERKKWKTQHQDSAKFSLRTTTSKPLVPKGNITFKYTW